LDRYTKQLAKSKLVSSDDTYDNMYAKPHALFSLIANHVANTAISVMEVEKIITGDPALYKWSKSKTKQKTNISFTVNGRTVYGENLEIENLSDTYSDKIKRLGSSESPGAKVRIQYSQKELQFDENLGSTKYTNLEIEDIEIPSVFLDEIRQNFKTQLIIDYIRNNKSEEFDKFLSELQKQREETNKKLESEGKKPKSKITKNLAIDMLYADYDLVEQLFDSLP